MRRFYGLLLAIFLLSCQPQTQTGAIVYFWDGKTLTALTPATLTPAAIALQAGSVIAPADRFYIDGRPVPADFPLPPAPRYTLQLRHAVPVTLLTPDGQKSFDSAALTVGQALREAGFSLYAADLVSPPPQTPINAPVTITYRPARQITIRVDGADITARTSAATVGQALASAGIALNGLDQSLPGAEQSVPADGQIKIIRIQESIILQQKTIPFQSQFVASAELELDTQNLLQVGEPGLLISRVRVRTENGVEVSRTTEAETMVRPPVDRIVGYGTNVKVRSLDVPGGQVQYWRAVRMYATWYSPCHSGINGCSYSTASGLPVKRGVVAFKRTWYNMMAGMRVYVPGYGLATVGDVGGGMPDGRPWIDLAYSEGETDHLSGWVTVYFLTPVPSNILYVME